MAWFIAIQHIGFGILEMFLFKGPIGQKIFRIDPAFAERAAPLMANQGLYNMFLAAGLILAELQGDLMWKRFFFACVIVAGIYGAATVSSRILWLQAAPAAIALALTFRKALS
jgi:putative membrane protein